jgi:hypothetical protein
MTTSTFQAVDTCATSMSDATRHALRLELLQEIADCVGTDLCNVFAVISGALQLQLAELGAAPTDFPWLGQAVDLARNGAEISQGLLELVEPQTSDVTVTDMDSLIFDHISNVCVDNIAFDVNIKPESDKIWRALCNPTAIRAVLQKIANSLTISKQNPLSIIISLENITPDQLKDQPAFAVRPRDYVKLSVTSGDCQLNNAERRNILTPLLLVKPRDSTHSRPHVDLPLNLSVAYASVRRCGGDMAVGSTPTGGLQIELLLPRAKWLSPEWFMGGVEAE